MAHIKHVCKECKIVIQQCRCASVDKTVTFGLCENCSKARSDKVYYIWSMEHNAWWNPDSAGYTTLLSHAGLYTKQQADLIVLSCMKNRNIDECMIHKDRMG